MSTPAKTARIHLIAAREAPYVVILRRKPSKITHILKLNTETNELESGSWFYGRIYEKRCDVSFDGKYMVYFAMGGKGDTWTAVCEPPNVKPIVDWENGTTYHGGGVFASAKHLLINPVNSEVGAAAAKLLDQLQNDFETHLLSERRYGGDEGILFPRLERDGFKPVSQPATEGTVNSSSNTRDAQREPACVYQPSTEHPPLVLKFLGYSSESESRGFRWEMPTLPGFLDEHVTWVAYDCLGQLIVARQGVVSKYTLEDLKTQTPSAVFDLEPLEPPYKRAHCG